MVNITYDEPLPGAKCSDCTQFDDNRRTFAVSTWSVRHVATGKVYIVQVPQVAGSLVFLLKLIAYRHKGPVEARQLAYGFHPLHALLAASPDVVVRELDHQHSAGGAGCVRGIHRDASRARWQASLNAEPDRTWKRMSPLPWLDEAAG